MAETAIAVALAVFEGMMIYFHNKKLNPKHEVDFDIEEVQTCLKEMQTTLTGLEEQIDEGIQEVELYAERVQLIAFGIEDAIDKFMLDMLSHQNMFDNVIKSASRKLSSDFNKIMIKKSKLCLEKNPQISSRSSTWSNQGIPEDDELVGFETHEEKLLEELRTTDQSRPVIFVVGPGGSGKSSLVGKVYRIFEAEDTFSVHWVELPKMMNKLEARRQPESSVQGQNDPAEKLRVLVNNKKFLVVLDDTWDTRRSKDDLIKIVKALPHSTPGSSIIITSRNTAVASWHSPKYMHDLSGGLSLEKGKELFFKRAFHDCQGNWPADLNYWANKILKKCEGMPLPISAIGTALLGKERPVEWRRLHDSLRSELWREDSDLLVIRSNLQPSYRDLSNHLKSCFLYFSMFPERYKISRERLIRLWVAEKFVISERRDGDNQLGKDYLNELVSRNLVVAFRDSVGVPVRSCRVRELVREINSSRRKSFLTVLEPDYRFSGAKTRRLSAHNGGLNLITGTIRTLLAFGKSSSLSQIEKVLKTNKFLKVLDLEGLPDLVEFPEHVVDLILLTYLSLRKTKVKRVPKSIQKLVLLETLDLKCTQVTKLPEEICQLHNLHHLLVNSYDPPSDRFNGVHISRHVEDLSSIQKLSLIKVDNREILIALGKLKGLRKLGLVELETKHGKDLCIALQQMKNLSTLDVRANHVQDLDLDHMEDRSPPLFLQTLYLRGRLQGLPKWISKLTSLRKIGIHWSKLNINPLEVLQDLPNLIELDLLDYYTGEELVFRADTFSKLLILKIERFEMLKSFEVGEKAMPRLEKLTISNCSSLTEVQPEELIGVLESKNNPQLQTGRKKQKIAAEEVTRDDDPRWH